MTGSRMDDADVRFADLSDIRGLAQMMIDGMYGNAGTKLPEGLEHPVHWQTEVVGSKASDHAYRDWFDEEGQSSLLYDCNWLNRNDRASSLCR